MNAHQETPNMTDILSEFSDLFFLQSYIPKYHLSILQLFHCSYEVMQQVAI